MKDSAEEIFIRGVCGYFSESQYCAFNPDVEKASCHEDAGGPIQFYPRGEDKVSSIVGIVSSGIVCGSTLPTVYTRVAYYIDWIKVIVWPNAEINRPKLNRGDT